MPLIFYLFCALRVPCTCPVPAGQLQEGTHVSQTPPAWTPQHCPAQGTHESLEGQQDRVAGNRQSPAVPIQLQPLCPCSQGPLLLRAGPQHPGRKRELCPLCLWSRPAT